MKKFTTKTVNILAPLALLAAITLPVFAGTAAVTPPIKSALNITCIQAAVDRRDSAMAAAAKSAYGSSFSTAFTIRKNALKAAWAISAVQARQTAINTAWKNFQTAQKAAAKVNLKAENKPYRLARQSAWAVYTAMRRACGVGAIQDDTHGPGSDAISQ